MSAQADLTSSECFIHSSSLSCLVRDANAVVRSENGVKETRLPSFYATRLTEEHLINNFLHFLIKTSIDGFVEHRWGNSAEYLPRVIEK